MLVLPPILQWEYIIYPQKKSQRRIGAYCENIVIFGKAFDQYCDSLTAKDIAKATGHILGDVVFLNGASAVGTFLKEIDALGKISNEAKVIVQGLKSAVEEHPAFETVEGIVLKMSDGMKKAGNAVKESAVGRQFVERVNNMKEFFELPFGKKMKPYSLKTSGMYDGQAIYRLTQDIGGTNLNEGYFYYLDKLHKDHIEVFNKQKKFVGVYNLDGTFNLKKFDAAKKQGRNIKNLV